MRHGGAGWTRREFCSLGAALALGLAPLRAAGRRPTLVKLGLIKSLFRDVPEPLVMFAMEPSRQFFEEQMGVKSLLRNGGSAIEMGKALKADELQLGVFHGVEFAWAKQQVPGLEPLFVAVNEQPSLRAELIVRKSARIPNIGKLKGKSLVLPTRGREHCNLFLERRCVPPGKTPKKHFGRITKPGGADSILDCLAAGEATSAVVDGIDWDSYKKRKPNKAEKLRPLLTSEPFPCALVAHHSGNLDPKLLERFREGMLDAHKTPKGRQMLGIMRITNFEKVPEDFDKQLEATAKAYPPRA